jgi:hypothetical protein
VIEDLCGCDEGKVVAGGALAKPGFLPDLVGPPVPCEHGVEPVTEGVAQRASHVVRVGLAHEQAAIATPKRDQALCVPADLVPRDGRFSLRRAQPPGRDQAAEVCVAAPVLSEKDEGRVVGQRDLRADDQMEAKLPRLYVRADDPVDAVAVGKGKRLEAKTMGLVHQFVGMARPFEEREVTLAPQRNI